MASRIACEREPEIICPYCGYSCMDGEREYGHVSYHGSEDGPTAMDCPNCDLEFDVQEHVQRTWSTLPKVQESTND